MKEKQQQLLFDKGITNVPSDALCSDKALEESLGMVYDNGEHRVIQKPKVFFDTAVYTSITSSGIPTILYIHKYNNQERYIGYVSGGTIVWGTKSGTTFTQIGTFGLLSYTQGAQITSIGKTLIIADDGNINYFLWKDNSYDELGEIPVPLPEYQMCIFEANANPKVVKNPIDSPDYSAAEYWYTERKDVVKHTLSFEGVFKTNSDFNKGAMDPEGEGSDEPWPEKYQEQYNNLVLGCYSANKKAVAQNNCFCNPFFVRIALELYDGSYYHIGAPMLMLPSVDSNSWVRMSAGYNFTLYTICRQLAVKQSVDYTDWSDIVKDVVLFVSDDIDVNETTMDIPVYESHGEFVAKSFCSETIGGQWSLEEINQDNAGTGTVHSDTSGKLRYHFNPLKPRTYQDMDSSIKGVSLFYRLCSIGIKSIGWTSTREKTDKHVLENITTQEHLENDDYFSACPFKAGDLYSYNSRLNMAKVSRGFFKGFDYEDRYTVDIDIEGSTKRIYHEITPSGAVSNRAQCFYFFYPDPRAKKLGTLLLTEHQGLHGAYYFKGLQSLLIDPDSGVNYNSNPVPSPEFTSDYELLPNYIIQSEVNNPFVFKAAGYFKVGTGRIIGMSTITQALSEGQFGQYPLLVFSESGIWSLSVASTGYYDSVRPMSREVALLENPCITQTDGAVFFASKKGLMVVVGSQVKCVSEQLSGKDGTFNGTTNLGNFIDFLSTAVIAYDYRDSLLWIFDKSHTACYVYSIKSGTFGKFDFGSGNAVTNVVNYYPDYLIQNANGIYSLMERDNINDDTDPYASTILTRPMKLENALALKSIMQVKHIHDLNDNATLALRIFASNNLKNWVELHSLRGTPWKYFRFRYDFTGLKATDRFAGTMLITQERRTDKLR